MMRVLSSSVSSEDLASFSFHRSPVLVIEDFWTPDERRLFREQMNQAVWKSLSDLPPVREDFPDSGNWAKAEIGQAEAKRFLSRLQLPCIRDYIESFPNIVGRHVGFNYYSYAAGDCLLTHDDTVQGRQGSAHHAPLRRIAVVTYFHDEWQPDWGGELMIYERQSGRSGGPNNLVLTQCIEPLPGSLVMFTVPRFHRVCRVDPTAGPHRRLSIAGWFMTEHSSSG